LQLESLEVRSLLAADTATISIAQSSIEVSEHGSTVNVDLVRSGGPGVIATVSFATVAGTATAGNDYSARSGTITFGVSDTSKTVSIPIVNDSIYEGTERFAFVLSNPAGTNSFGNPVAVQLGSPNPCEITIDDDDILDSSFSGDGRTTTSTVGAAADMVGNVAVQPDGEILVLGSHTDSSGQLSPLDLTRFLPGGGLDPAFGNGGKVSLSPSAAYGDSYASNEPDLAVLPNGKILATLGLANYLTVVQFNPNGTLDKTFLGAGIGIVDFPTVSNVSASAFVVQPDGRILIAAIGEVNGASHLVFARLLPDGQVDNSFHFGHRYVSPILADGNHIDLAMTPNGQFVVAANLGTKGIVARFTHDVFPDKTFDGDGVKTIDFGPGQTEMLRSVAVASNGRILVGGNTTTGVLPNQFALARLLAKDGAYDPSLDQDGQLVGSLEGNGKLAQAKLDASGRILLVGDSQPDGGLHHFVVQRRFDAGMLDATFNNGGTVSVDFDPASDAFGAAVALSGNSIVAAGTSGPNVAVAKFFSDPPPGPFAVVQLASESYAVNEGDDTLAITLERSGDTSHWARVDWGVSSSTAAVGRDLRNAGGTVVFKAGETTHTILVPIIDDTLYELSEAFRVSLNNATGITQIGERQSAVVTIADNDPVPQLTIDDASAVEGDSGISWLYFTFTLSAISGLPARVNYGLLDGSATRGHDYFDERGAILIPAGLKSVQLGVEIIGDTIHESTEYFRIQIYSPINATLATSTVERRGTIIDNDPAPAAAADAYFAALLEVAAPPKRPSGG
jgi:uncharacterized delta-60 repeat protein